MFTILVWAFVFIILLLAIAITLLAVLSRAENFLGGPAFRDYLQSPAAFGLVASVQGFRSEIVSRSPDSVALVSFDYSAATEAEMEPMAEAVLSDLLSHQMRVVAVSLQPEGALMAQRLLNRFDGTYPYGQRTLNLGYLPGQAAGVRSLASIQDLTVFQGGGRLADYPQWQDLESPADVALFVEIADSGQSVRWWVEQQAPLALNTQPMLAAVSASVAPTARPYYRATRGMPGHLDEMISGVTASAAYEFYLGQPGRALHGIGAQSVAHLGLVVTAIAGTFAGFRGNGAA